MLAVKINKVSKYFKNNGARFDALKNLSINIQKGEIFGVLGANGAGKTTLLNCINGMLIPDKGNIKIFGKELAKNRKILEKMNSVSGETRFHWNLSANQILNFYCMLYKVPKAEREKRIKGLISDLEISEFMDKKFTTLSTGQRVRLVLAKSLINHPKLLLLDEPTLGLDPDIAIKVRKKICDVRDKYNTTILLTSHYMHEVEQLCDRIAFLHKGQLIDIGSVKDVKTSKFNTYKIIIDIKNPKKAPLQRMGFKVRGKQITKQLKHDQDISKVLSELVKGGYKIIDMEVKKPSLEDYFVKMLK
ncbi:MAG: Trehalose/maltose import ATP-binding protein MalK [Candidatus Woesearchaeota archaeon]|nr:Trehalose/maltose import ATP-binding protein MalK [Candidatus Woesearchaeota archaeon]